VPSDVERCSATGASDSSSVAGMLTPYGGGSAQPGATVHAHDLGPESSAMLIAGWEPDDSRWPIIVGVCTACGARPHRLTGTHRSAVIEESQRYAAAIVALHERPESPDSCLPIVTQLKEFGLCVIAHESAVATWPIASRCRVLLAGARYLLDSQSPDFQQVLLATLRDLLATQQELRDEEGRIRDLACAHGIVGQSESLLEAFRSLVRMSKLSDLPVLITGESGTGKELFALALHALDPKRRQGPFVAVNCAAINAGVAESELFGHVRGAFTGASNDHSGLFQAAQGGVLFLDEIGELNPDVQAKILRVLQDKRVLRVGAGKDAPVDVRIVAATNQDLAQMMKDGRFRTDLFHRLNSLSIRISPLRERIADLPLLVAHFVSEHEPQRELAGIDPDLIDALSYLKLPGNVRELKNLITTALAAKTDHRPLELKDLPSQVWEELSLSRFADSAPQVSSPVATSRHADDNCSMLPDVQSFALSVTDRQGWNLQNCLSHCEREIVKAAMRQTSNNQSEAARLLGLTPRSIYNKLRKHQLLRKPIA
jgi:transcriptional regulator with PAS, ATPase and Fis domain